MNRRYLYEEAMFKLLNTKPFYAKMIMNMNLLWNENPRQMTEEEKAQVDAFWVNPENLKKMAEQGIDIEVAYKFRYLTETASVGVTNTGIQLKINAEMFEMIPISERAAILEHECLHCILEHTGYRRPKEVTENRESSPNVAAFHHKIANLAQDLAINQFIDNIPAFAVNVKVFSKKIGKELRERAPYEYYYNQLLEDADKNGNFREFLEMLDKGNVKLTIDDHSENGLDGREMGDLPGYAKQIISELIKKTANQMGGAGHVPGELQQYVDMLNKSIVNWKSLLRNFVANSVNSRKINTRKKPHRRFGIEQPGFKREKLLTVVVCVDSSGSVSDLALTQFWSEIDHIAKIYNNVQFVQADCVVQNFGKYKRDKIQNLGRGGTAYQPAIDKALELDADCIIYMGDGDSADEPKNPRIPFLWAMLPGCKPPVDWGRTITLEAA